MDTNGGKMQKLDSDILRNARLKRMGKLEGELSQLVKGTQHGERITCPVCQYESRKNKTTALIFRDGKNHSIKCFACGIWKKV